MTPQFYVSHPSACPYLPGLEERKVFTEITDGPTNELHEFLAHCGFRRSQTMAYRPACEACNACTSVRVLTSEFRYSSNMKRILSDNRDLIGIKVPNTYSSEQYALFRRYQEARHGEGGMADMSVQDYRSMVEASSANTFLIEYRYRDADSSFTGRSSGPLIGLALTDEFRDGFSMVYSFFDPEKHQRSLGTYIILDHIERTRKAGLPYLYLGYWVKGSRKMDYKKRFTPQEHLTSNGWELSEL